MSWDFQALQGRIAKRMGYDGAESIDEQGDVYIIPMLDKKLNPLLEYEEKEYPDLIPIRWKDRKFHYMNNA